MAEISGFDWNRTLNLAPDERIFQKKGKASGNSWDYRDETSLEYWKEEIKARKQAVSETPDLKENNAIPVNMPGDEYASNQNLSALILPVIRKREIEEKKDYIYNRLKNDDFEPGMLSELQSYLEKELVNETKGKEMQILLEEIYLDLYSDFFKTKMFRDLLIVVSQIGREKIYPTGPVMALAATRHKNLEIREAGLRCFENWADKRYITLLRTIYFEEKWLQHYCDLIIKDLEED